MTFHHHEMQVYTGNFILKKLEIFKCLGIGQKKLIRFLILSSFNFFKNILRGRFFILFLRFIYYPKKFPEDSNKVSNNLHNCVPVHQHCYVRSG